MNAPHDAFNAAIRASAGHPQADSPAERPVGSAGIGRGNAATPRRRAPASMTGLIRASVAAHREHWLDAATFYDEVMHGW